MNDIEKKAREYAEEAFSNVFLDEAKTWNEVNEVFVQTFLAGAAYALGNQWRDAEKELPEDEQNVLIVYRDVFGEHLGIGFYDTDYKKWKSFNFDIRAEAKVFAWMRIPEYKPKGE